MGAWGIPRASRDTVLVLLALVVGAAGCGGEASDERAERARLIKLGERVFAEKCRTCHPLLGQPNDAIHDDYHPPLDLDQVSPSPGYAREMVETGGVGMGGYRRALSGRELRAVVAYVLEVGGREVGQPEGVTEADVERGRVVFDKYCQSCHQLAGRPATRPNPIWAGTNFDELRPGVLLTERIVREGQREAMPSFSDRISRSGIRAVAVYLNAAARGGVQDTP